MLVLKLLNLLTTRFLAFRHELLIYVQGGRCPRVAHLPLCIFHICTGHFQPNCMRSTETSPVNPAKLQLPCCWLYESSEDVVVANGLAIPDRLKYQVVGSVGLYRTIYPHGSSRSDPDCQDFEPVYSLNNASVYCDRGIRAVAFGSAPVATAVPLINCD